MIDRTLYARLLRSRPWIHPSDEDAPASGPAEPNPEAAELRQRCERFNLQVREELRQIPIPAGWREKLTAAPTLAQPKPAEPALSRPRFRFEHRLALAASLVILGLGLFYWFRPPPEDLSLAGFRSRMAGFARREYRMDLLTQDLKALRQFFAQQGVAPDFDLPQTLSALPLKGGARLTWQGRPVSMVCFEWPRQQTLYLFVVKPDSLEGKRPARTDLAEEKGLATAAWEQSGVLFLLAGPVPLTELEGLVKL